jgi:hypothetical protein
MEIREGTQRIENGTKRLLETDRDTFRIISTAGFGGRRGYMANRNFSTGCLAFVTASQTMATT